MSKRMPVAVGTAVAVVSLFLVQADQGLAPAAARAARARHVATARLTSATAYVGTHASRVVMSPNDVVVSAATVAANLVSVSTDGDTFVFKRAAGALGKLAPGKVMLLQGYAAALVASVSHAGGRLTVTTKPASITDVFKDADIDFSQDIDFSKVFGILGPDVEAASVARRAELVRPHTADASAAGPSYPNVGLSYTGKVPGNFPGGLAYVVTVTPTPKQLKWSILACLGAAVKSSDDCQNSSTGFAMDASISGFIANGKVTGGFDILNGHNSTSTFSFLSNGGIFYTYKLVRSTGASGSYKLPAFRFPITFDIPFYVLDVPMFLKVQFAILFTAALTAKNEIVQGGQKLDYSGSEGVRQSGGSDSGISKALSIAGHFLTSLAGESITLASAAFELASQMKVGFGPGIPAINVLGYGDIIVALGEVTPPLAAPGVCGSYYLNLSAHAYLEAQFFGFKLTSSVVDLFKPIKASTKLC